MIKYMVYLHEQMLDYPDINKHKTMFFDNLEQAQNWLGKIENTEDFYIVEKNITPLKIRNAN